MDTNDRERVRAIVALSTGQPMLNFGRKGDGSLAWVKTQTSKGELFIGLVYGSYKRPRRVAL